MNPVEIALKRPFAPHKLRWRKGGGSKELVYITARDVMDRLDEVCGINGWQTNFDYLGDALKRAAVQFGIGRYLYHPNAFDANKNPASWATPEGYDALMEKRHGKE